MKFIVSVLLFVLISTFVHAANTPVIFAGSDTAKVLTTSLVNKNGTSFLLSTDVSPGVTGPGSSTDNAAVRFDGVGGQTLQNSVFTIGDTGTLTTSLTGSGAIDGLVFNNSASTIPKIKWSANGGSGIRFYVDSTIAAIIQDNGQVYASGFSTLNGINVTSANTIRVGSGPGFDLAGEAGWGVRLDANGSSQAYSGALFQVYNNAAANVAMQIKAAGSQSANLLEFRDSSNTLLTYFDSAGVFSGASGANTTLSNLGTTAINAALIPGGSAFTKDLGTEAKPWRNLYIEKALNVSGGTIIDFENYQFYDGGGIAFDFADPTDTKFYNNLIPGSGNPNVGSSAKPLGNLFAINVGFSTGTVWSLPTAAGTAGQLITNDGSAHGSWGSGPITARAHASATTISGTLATVVWTTEDFDNTASLASGIFTCPENGKYQVNASLAISGTLVLNNTSVMEIQVDGTATSNVTHYIAGAITNDQLSIGDVVNCAAASQIRIQVSNSGTSPTIVSSNTKNWFSVARVGTL